MSIGVFRGNIRFDTNVTEQASRQRKCPNSSYHRWESGKVKGAQEEEIDETEYFDFLGVLV
jgi:hypothetical protein